MSTLMHLPGDGMATALSELKRVVRPGGVVEIGEVNGFATWSRFDHGGHYQWARVVVR